MDTNSKSRWKLVLLVVASGLTIAGACQQWSRASRMAAIDYYQYWSLSQAVSESIVDNIYDPSARRLLAEVFFERAAAGGSAGHRSAAAFRKRDLQAASTPLLYAFVHFQATGAYDRDLMVYRGASLVATLLAIGALCYLLGAAPLGAVTAMAMVVWLYPPLRDDLGDGNVNQIQFVLLVCLLWLQRLGSRSPGWQVAAGTLLGVSIFLKPNLAFVAICLGLGWSLTGRWRSLAYGSLGILLGAVVSVAASSRLFGSFHWWGQWLEVLVRLDKVFDVGIRWGNFGGARLLREATGADLSVALNVVAVGILAWIVWRRRQEQEAFRLELLLVGCGAVLPILTMGLAWPHYLMLALPLALTLVFGASGLPLWRRPPVFIVLVTVGLLAISSSLLFDVIQIGGMRAMILRASTLALGTLLLYVVGLWELANPVSPEADRNFTGRLRR